MKCLGMPLAGIVASLFLFPFNIVYFPAANTKMILAAIGLILLFFNMAKQKKGLLDNTMLSLSFWGIIISIVAFAASVYNETYDYTYASYIMSMWVWLGGAYTVILTIKGVHGRLDVDLICHYLIGVCVTQCILAFTMDQYAPLKNFVDSFLASEGFMGKVEGRIYGIGASLDVAGMRFAAVLLIIGYLAIKPSEQINKIKINCYVIAFMIIVIIGNMIGRTTTVGALIALTYWLCAVVIRQNKKENAIILWKSFIVIILIFLPLTIYLYNTNNAVHSNIRFGFEGFFSLFENGEWETNSNNALTNMYVFPDNFNTWLIGDGYFDNPNLSKYYTGKQWGWFYQNTDVGYCRFIFYFGVLGLIAFSTFMIKTTSVCMSKFKDYRLMFFAIGILNFIVWFKVSSDLFSVFAPFLCLVATNNNDNKTAINII